ncbi:MAG: calcium/sodium antiporter [Candidatus Pacebacteria bacterium]|nr:calcium/sodium antiporter [Candidatus Paceibacterota bacterium]
MFLTILLFIVGFALLVKGADMLVDGSVSIAERYGISSIVIGLTIVAFGTSAPELVVNLMSAFSGNVDLAVGNIIGSNIANVLLILGVSSLIFPLIVHKNTAFREIPFAIGATLLLVILSKDSIFGASNIDILSRLDGLVLIFFFVLFLIYTFKIAKIKSPESPDLSEQINNSKESIQSVGSPMSISKSIIYIVLGLAGLIVGGKWIVDGAVSIATLFGISESMIGLTIVAIGTSLPELATSIVAAFKKQSDIAIGNIVGSNIFNIFWILGITSVINPLPIDKGSDIDFIFLIFSSVLLFVVLLVGKKYTIEKWQGMFLTFAYVVYLVTFWFR